MQIQATSFSIRSLGLLTDALAPTTSAPTAPSATDPTPCPTAPFSDVARSHPFCSEIAWMAREGISQGHDDGTFRPTTPVTRQAMSAFMSRLAD